MSQRPSFSRTAQFGYDLGTWPHYTYLDFSQDGSTGTTFTLTPSTGFAKISQQLGTGTGAVLVDDFPTFQSADTNLTIINEGNSTDYVQNFNYYTPIDAIVDRLTFNVAVALQVSAYTSGTFANTQARIIMTSFKATGQTETPKEVKHNLTAQGNLTAVGNQYCILNVTYTDPFPLYAGGAFQITFDINTTTGVGTYQKGILASFPYQVQGGLRTYSKSGVAMYARPMARKGSNTMTPADYAAEAGGV